MISKPLSKIFQKSLDQGIYPASWKLANVTALHKKGSIYECNNYRPISLLPCVSKICEKLVFNQIYTYLIRNNLINANQSGFRPGDSTVRQLTAICHRIGQSLDNGDELLAVFLDFKKAFDKVWHKGLTYKLDNIGIRGSLLKWLTNYLSNRQQCVVIQGRKSSYKYIHAGVPQGSVLGPLLFLVYINDICSGVKSIVQLYADDTSLFHVIKNRNIISAVNAINDDLLVIQRWSHQWLVEVSTDKSVTMIISRKSIPTGRQPVIFGNNPLKNVCNHKHLGLWFDTKLSWSYHIDQICIQASKRLNMMLPLKYKLSRNTLETMYISYVRPILEYGDIIFDNCSTLLKNNLEKIQIRAAQIVTGGKRFTSNTALYRETGWTTLSARRHIHKLILFHQIVHHIAPSYLTLFIPPAHNVRVTRQTDRLLIPQFQCKTDAFLKSFYPSVIHSWNNTIDNTTRHNINKSSFKRMLNKQFAAPVCTELERMLHSVGSRPIQICMSQMRMGFSNLNSDLFAKQCTVSPDCHCGLAIETKAHFFHECITYCTHRNNMLRSLATLNFIVNPSVEIILHGLPNECIGNNIALQAIFHLYINATNRFT